MELSDSTQFVRDPDVLGADVGPDHVLLSPELDYVGLDIVATRIWHLLEDPQSIDELVTTLSEEYDVDEQSCRTDVRGFLESLLSFKVITQVSA